MWYLLAFLSALFYSFRGVFEKRIVHKTNKYVLGLGVRLFAVPFFFLPFLFHPELYIAPAQLGWDFWLPVLIICIISTPLENYFYYEALKEEELSLALPILSLSPVVTIGVAAVVLHEYPAWLGVVGMFLIIAGIYALKVEHAREGWLEPLKHLRGSRGVQLMLVVMVSIAVSGVLDKVAVNGSNPYMYAVVNYVLVSITLFIMAWIKARKHLGQLWTYAPTFIVLGVVVAAYTLLYLVALSTGITPYVIAIKNSSILFSIIFGLVLLRERDARAKILAGILIFAGLVCIKVFG